MVNETMGRGAARARKPPVAEHQAGQEPGRASRSWSPAGLILVGALVLTVWLRAYSFGAALGWKVWPRTPSSVEPLDCDEAVYAYIGRRLLRGDVLYRDVTETRPPAGYALYGLAVALGGYTELTVRALPLPFALATVALVWLFAFRFYGPYAAGVAVFLEAMLNNDPYVYGNGANFELFMNPLTLASLYLMAGATGKGGGPRTFGAGVCLGLAALFKQVVVTHLALYLWLVWRTAPRPRRRAAALLGGAALPWLGAAAVLAWQGALADFLQIVFVYGPEMAAGATKLHGLRRWSAFVSGNPQDAWWGWGSWPVWAAGLAGALLLLLRPRRTIDRFLILWTLSCCVQVMLPGLYWQHYYALAIPGMVLLSAAGLARLKGKGMAGRTVAVLGGALLVGGTGWLQYRNVLTLDPSEVTVRAKGGGQWLADREAGRLIRTRLGRPGDRLFIWGWQSPIQFYSGCDSVTPYFFTDPLMAAFASRSHPLVDLRKRRIRADLEARRPEWIFLGQAPFAGLADFLAEGYQPMAGDLGLWVRGDRFTELRSSFNTNVREKKKREERREKKRRKLTAETQRSQRKKMEDEK